MKVQTQTHKTSCFSSVIYTEGATAAGASEVDGFAEGGGQVRFSEGLRHRLREERFHFSMCVLTSEEFSFWSLVGDTKFKKEKIQGSLPAEKLKAFIQIAASAEIHQIVKEQSNRLRAAAQTRRPLVSSEMAT